MGVCGLNSQVIKNTSNSRDAVNTKWLNFSEFSLHIWKILANKALASTSLCDCEDHMIKYIKVMNCDKYTRTKRDFDHTSI